MAVRGASGATGAHGWLAETAILGRLGRRFHTQRLAGAQGTSALAGQSVIIGDEPWEKWTVYLNGRGILYDDDDRLFKTWYLASDLR